MSKPNQHIEEYLEDYCDKSKTAPEFAVMIKGKWGSSKTFFIKQFIEKTKGENNKGTEIKFLYVSLYGVTSYEQIEDIFFRELHPVLSSKPMALGGKIIKGLIKTTVKIDFDDDGKPDGAVGSQIPNINITEYLTDTEGFILVFDDVERCQINISDLLGYINHFVEHQGYKVILLSNEEEILKRDNKNGKSGFEYKNIKEKLIGKTFEVEPDFDDALAHFISGIKTDGVKQFYNKDNVKNNIQSLFKSSTYYNLRHLKRALWDFERLFNDLPSEAIVKHELLYDLFQLYLIYSFEIQSGKLRPCELESDGYSFRLGKQLNDNGTSNIKESQYERISNKYEHVSLLNWIIDKSLWVKIFDKGIIDKNALKESILKSKYFSFTNAPNWLRLCYPRDLTDDEFDKYLSDVETSFNNKEYEDLGEIKHITDLFLWFAEIGVYDRTKESIIKSSRLYVLDLKRRGIFVAEDTGRTRYYDPALYVRRGYFGEDSKEFKGFCEFVDDEIEKSKKEDQQKEGKELLKTMTTNINEFNAKLSPNYYNGVTSYIYQGLNYYETPILEYLSKEEFVKAVVNLYPKEIRNVNLKMTPNDNANLTHP